MNIFIKHPETKEEYKQCLSIQYQSIQEDGGVGNLLISPEEYQIPELDISHEKMIYKDWYCLFLENNSIGYCKISPRFGKKLHRSQHNFILGSIYIMPVYQGQGYGKKLLDGSLELLKKEHPGLINLLLWVKTNNKSAINLYEKTGFGTIGVEKMHTFFQNQYHDAYIMQKILGEPDAASI